MGSLFRPIQDYNSENKTNKILNYDIHIRYIYKIQSSIDQCAINTTIIFEVLAFLPISKPHTIIYVQRQGLHILLIRSINNLSKMTETVEKQPEKNDVKNAKSSPELMSYNVSEVMRRLIMRIIEKYNKN